MRKIVLKSLLAAVLAVTVSTTACNKGDPNALETHVENLGDAEKRGDAIKQLERIVSGIATDPNDVDRRNKFAEVVVPKLAEIYDADDVAPYRDQILDMALKMKRPEAVVIWSKAVAVESSSGIDGSAEGQKRAIMALQGIRDANATAAAGDVITAFKTLMEKPSKDMASGQEGVLRFEMAKTLGALKSKEAVDPLLAALAAPETEQPKGIYKAAIDALGQIGDPKAVDALITVQFSVADAPGTQSIGERAIRALGAIGAPAVPKLVETMEGKNEAVNKLAAQNDVDVQLVQQLAVKILGVVGSSDAAPSIIAYMPQRDCGGDTVVDPKTLEDFDVAMAGNLRAFAANSLGFIGDPSAIEPLCKCRNATHNPGDLWEITAGLGRIGDKEGKAFECLQKIVTDNYYSFESDEDEDAAAKAAKEEFKYEIRWQGIRYLILAAPHDKTAEIKAAIDGNDAKVKAEVEKLGWATGIAVLEECKDDKGCYEKIMSDSTKPWFDRELAAFNFARRSEPGDIESAAKLAKAFKTRDPEARIHIAWLTAKVAAGKPCPACAAALEDVMKAEELTKEPTMQGAWLTARQSISKLTGGSGGGE
ncbi:MAG TPA: HEAT repeat domain-containing protein [Enhygromyxa sp.]|nr:HEAT repeat domain-containing protein [Enhygromyxa sp.]